LKSILSVGIDQLGVACQQTNDVVDFARRCRFEDRQRNGFVGKERGDCRLTVIGSDEDWAQSIFFDVDQCRVDDELSFYLIAVPLFDCVEKA
jgi:hypothetical protein